MGGYFIYNGAVLTEGEKIFSPDNRGYRYGDGLFETVRVKNGSAPLWDIHMQRLFSSLDKLKMTIPVHLNAQSLHNDVQRLLQKNKLTDARIRISLYRGDGGLTDPIPSQAGYLIQSWPIQPETLGFNNNGLHIGIYPDAHKSTDFLANLKSANYLPYVMASLYTKEKKWNDALILNHRGGIADSCIANLFWIKNEIVFTVPLSEGPVQGVMRRYLCEQLNISEKPVTSNELLEADEIFLTNAVKGIQWVGMFEDRRMPPPFQSMKLYQQYIQPLFG